MSGIIIMFGISSVFAFLNVKKEYRWYENLEITIRSFFPLFLYLVTFWFIILNALSIHYAHTVVDLSEAGWGVINFMMFFLTLSISSFWYFAWKSLRDRIGQIEVDIVLRKAKVEPQFKGRR